MTYQIMFVENRVQYLNNKIYASLEDANKAARRMERLFADMACAIPTDVIEQDLKRFS